MDKILLQDSEKKESKRWLILMIVFIIIGVGNIIFYCINQSNYNTYEFVAILIVSIAFSLIFFYGFLCCFLYKLIVTNEEIIIRTLYGVKKIKLDKGYKYSFKKYTKVSEFYTFTFLVEDKKVKFYTRYYEELDKILKTTENNPT